LKEIFVLNTVNIITSPKVQIDINEESINRLFILGPRKNHEI